ncbi:hypothetical protein FACS1894102_2310 [Spirochaetia bacterium]|nr:hypothetical protein FACS1894102_2310 [Spirochaetia bacterium]
MSLNFATAYSFEVVIGGIMKQQDEAVAGVGMTFWWSYFHQNFDVAFGPGYISPGWSEDFYIPLIEGNYYYMGLAPGVFFNLQIPLDSSDIIGEKQKFDVGIHLPIIFRIGLLLGSSRANVFIGSFMLQITPALSVVRTNEGTSFAGFRGSSILLAVTFGYDNSDYPYK